MKTLMSFLLGAATVALVTTERGRHFCDELTEELTESAKKNIRELNVSKEITKNDCEGSSCKQG